MVPIQEIRTENIRGVVYVTGAPGLVTAVKLILEDGHIHVYSGENLPAALEKAKQRFRPEPEETRLAEQLVKE